jgi:Protein of unknown function (DUF4127)
MRKIVALPVDGRPVVRAQVAMLLECADVTLVTPPVAALGHFREPAGREALKRWLVLESVNADGVVLSIDMLVYGGLVPSRFIDDSLESLRTHLDVIEDIKQRNPATPVFAFAATMRLSNNNVNEEEKTYWADYGRAIWAWSYHSDKFAVTKNAADQRAAETAAASIPDAIRNDYLATRARNFAVTRCAIDLLARGSLDRLILPQDDTAEFGFNIAERRALEAEIAARGLVDRARVYPGADEVIHTLCARMVHQSRGERPLQVFVSPGDPQHIGTLHALYEDRPVLESIVHQIEAVGAVMATEADAADVVLAVHTCGSAQGDWAMRKSLPEPKPVSRAWTVQLAAWRARGLPIAVADVAYANGGDPRLIEVLSQHVPLDQLAAYGGWNTASNTIGSVLAQCMLARGTTRRAANRKVLALRLLEDVVYQAEVRQQVRADVDEATLSAAERTAAVRDAFVDSANTWAHAHQLGWRVTDIALPWGRMFEIDIHLEPAT